MNETLIFHNPRCSKSRATLLLLKDNGIDPEIVEYLEDAPAKGELKFICSSLGIKPIELIRTKEDRFKELGLSERDDRKDNDWIDLMCKNPILIERPIVIHNKKVAVGRPPENVLKIIN